MQTNGNKNQRVNCGFGKIIYNKQDAGVTKLFNEVGIKTGITRVEVTLAAPDLFYLGNLLCDNIIK